MATDVSIRLGVTGERDLTAALKGVESRIKNLNAEMKAAVSSMAGMDSAEASTAKKTDILGRSVEAAKEKIGILSQQYDKAKAKLDQLGNELDQAKAAFGENSAEALKAEAAFNRQASTVNHLGAKLNNATADLNRMEAELRDVDSAADKAGDALEDMGDDAREGSNSLRDAFTGGAVSGAIQSLIGGISGLVESTSEYRRIMGSLEVASSNAGYTAQETAGSYRQLYGVLADEQSSATALSNLQALGLSQADLTTLIDGTIGAWATYGDSIPIDSLAEAINETIRVGKVTGTFADVLNWAGTSEDDFNKSLEDANSETERANLVLKELSRQGLPQAAKQWRENNTALVETNEASANLSDALARAGEALSPLVSKVKNFAADMVNGFVDMAESGSAAIPVITGLATAIGVLAAATVVKKVAELASGLGLIAAAANPITLVIAAAAGLSAAIVTLTRDSGDFMNSTEVLSARFDETAEAVNASAESFQTLQESSAQSMSQVQSEMGLVEQYVAELQSITDANGRVTEGYEQRAKYLADYINNQVPGAVAASGSEENAIYKVSGAIDNLIFKRKQEAALNALQPAYEEALTNQLRAFQERNEAQREYNVALENVNRLQEQSNNYVGRSATEMAQLREQLRAAKEHLAQTEETLNTANGTWQEYNNTIASYEGVANAATGDMTALNEAIARSSTSVVQATGTNQQALEKAVAEMQADYQSMIMYVAEHWAQMSAMEQQGWLSLLQQQRTALDTQVNEAREGGVQIPTAVGEGMNLGGYQLTGAAQELYLQLLQELYPGIEVSDIGNAYDVLLANGILFNSGQVNAAGVTTGQEATTGYKTGVEQSTPEANAASADMVYQSKASMDTAVDNANFQESGQTIVGNAKSGADSSKPDFITSISDLAPAGKSALDGSIGSSNFQGSGQMITDNTDAGYKANMSKLYDTIRAQITNAKRSADANVQVSDFPGVGRNIASGIASGITSNSSVVYNAVRRVIAQAKAEANAAADAHSPSRLFRDEVGRWIAEGIAVGVEDYAKDVYKATRDIIPEVVDIANELNNKLVAKEEELTKRLEATGLDEATKESLNAQLTAVKEFRSEYEKALADIEKSQDSMAKKLQDYGNLFETVKTETGSFLELSDLEAQINGIERYGEALEALKARGVSDSLLDEIVGMNVEDATAYTEKLLAMTDDQYTEYMALWQRKQQEAQAIAQTFYQDEMDALGKEFVDKIPQELGDVKDEMRSIGVQGIQGMIDGMYSRSGALWSAAASIVSQAIAAMRAAADINSPSRVTENLVGKPLAQGIEVGFLDTMARVSHRMADTILTPFQSVTRGDLLDAAAGVVNGNAGLAVAGAGTAQTIVIPVQLNGKQIAEVVYDPLKQVGRQRGD